MGEIADMMLDGTLCAGCGVYLEGDTIEGIPNYCEDCQDEGFNDEAIAQREARKPEKIKCSQRNKRCGGQQGLNAHIKSKHPEILCN